MKTVLAITAHPDDESFLFGGVLAQHARRGGRAVLLCLTDGQVGRTGGLCEQAELGAVRRQELSRAVDVLGISELRLERLMDGALREIGDEDGAAIVKGYIDEVGADVLLTFGPEGASGHEDHRCCYRWTTGAANGQRIYVSSFPEDLPPPREDMGPFLEVTTAVDVSELGDLKRRAFLEHKTQADHLGIFDRIQAALGGKEFYHRISPPWSGGPLETSVVD